MTKYATTTIKYTTNVNATCNKNIHVISLNIDVSHIYFAKCPIVIAPYYSNYI